MKQTNGKLVQSNELKCYKMFIYNHVDTKYVYDKCSIRTVFSFLYCNLTVFRTEDNVNTPN